MPLLEKRTNKYLPLRERLLSIQSNIFQNQIHSLSPQVLMRCFVCMEKGVGKVREKRFFLSENSIFLIA